MFFPIGFGNWPRLFPFAIAGAVIVCVMWSFSFFPVLSDFEKQVKNEAKLFDERNVGLVRQVFREACRNKFDAAAICSLMAENMGEKRFSWSSAESAKARKMPGGERFENILTFARSFYKKSPDEWPKEVKSTPKYAELDQAYLKFKSRVAELKKEHGLMTRQNLSAQSVVRASFTHGDFWHLFGNLVFLIIFGVWVDQRMGFVGTAAVFLTGSFAGLFSQVYFHPESYVLGASAGISAIMGAFFAFFYKAEFHFIFSLGFLYFKRIVMPIIWVIPAFYVMSDFTSMLAGERTEVAHLAHLVGFVVGCALGYVHTKLFPVAEGQLFSQESQLLQQLRETESPAEIWRLFNDIMKWNLQNSEAAVCFMQKWGRCGLVLQNKDEMKLCNRYISTFMARCFRLGSVREILTAVESFPPKLPLAEYTGEVPVRQILLFADFAAQRGKVQAAFNLYSAAWPKLKQPNQIAAVQQAINSLAQMQAANNFQKAEGE